MSTTPNLHDLMSQRRAEQKRRPPSAATRRMRSASEFHRQQRVTRARLLWQVERDAAAATARAYSVIIEYGPGHRERFTVQACCDADACDVALAQHGTADCVILDLVAV